MDDGLSIEKIILLQYLHFPTVIQLFVVETNSFNLKPQ